MFRSLRRPVLLVLIAAALIAIGYWNILPQRFVDAPASSTPQDSAIDGYALNTRTIQYRLDGKIQYELKAERSEHVKATDVTLVTRPDMLAFRGTDFPWQFLLVVNILLLVAGAFMEPSAIILILAPILFPIAVQLGIDPIHLGIIMVVNMEIGLITPPVGLNLFVTSAVTGMPLANVIRAAWPWLMLLISFLLIITYIPAISLALPNWLGMS